MTEGRRGSVRQDDSGSWFYIVDIGSSTHRRQVRKRGFTSKRTAQAALTALLRSVDVGEYVEPSRLTLRRYVEDFWLPNAKMRLRPSTAHSYERNLRLHVLPTLGDVPLQKLTGPQLTQLYAALRDDGLVDRSKGTKDHKGLSVRTTRYVHTILGAVLKSAVKADLLHRNPADQAEPPRMTSVANGTTPMRTWSAAEVAQFLHRREGHTGVRTVAPSRHDRTTPRGGPRPRLAARRPRRQAAHHPPHPR